MIKQEYKAENLRIDSLKKVILTNQKDTSTFNAYESLLEHYSNTNMDSAGIIGKEYIQLLKNMAQMGVDTVHIKLYNKHLSNTYNSMSDLYFKIGAKEISKNYTDSAINIQANYNDTKGLANSYLNRALLFSWKAEQDSSIYYYKKSIEINGKPKNSEDTINYVITLFNIGELYFDVGMYDEALNYYYEMLSLSEKARFIEGEMYASMGLGLITLQTDSSQAQYYFNRSLEASKQSDQDFNKLKVHRNIADWYIKNKQFDSAFYLLNLNRELVYKLKSESQIGEHFWHYGFTFLEKGDLDSAYVYFSKAKAMFKNMNSQRHLINLEYHIADIQYQKKNYAKALKIADETAQLAYENDMFHISMLSLQLLEKIYKETGKYEKAYTVLIEINELKEQALNVENQKMALRMHLNLMHQQEISEKEIQKEKKANELLKAQLNNYKLRRTIIIGILLFCLIFISAWILYILQKRKNHKKIESLQKQALQLQMNPHFFFNALNSINHYIAENEKDKARYFLSKFARLMRLILENNQDETIPIELEAELIENYLSLEQIRKKNFEFEINIDSSVQGVKIPPMFIQPLVENSVKHGFSENDGKGKLVVEAKKRNGKLSIEVTDNGKVKEMTMEINPPDEHQSLSMDILKKRILLFSKNKGALIRRQTDQGFHVNITLPLNNI